MEENKIVSFLEKTKTQQYKSDIGFRTLVESVNDNLYIIPKYQRKYRWSRKQVVGLVYSLIRGLPIPPIYTWRNGEGQLEILDGQQRVMSLFFYYIGRYMKTQKNAFVNFCELETNELTFKEAILKEYELEELHIEMQDESGSPINLDYLALPKSIKRKLDYTTITIIEIKIDQENKREEVLRTIFANLNKGGTLLSDQEQRNGIYNCEFYDFLQQFNRKYEPWRNLWGREDRQEKDMETLLRLCALKKYLRIKTVENREDFVIDGYNSSYTKMLDRFSEEAMLFSEKEGEEYSQSLTEFIGMFDKNTRFSSNIALLESFYVVYEKKKIRKRITKKICENVLKSPKYSENTRQGTVKMKKMNERWKAVYEILSRSNL